MTKPSVNATIDSVVHGSQSVLSFRQLSALCDIPLREARHVLAAYVDRAVNASGKGKQGAALKVLYHVTTTGAGTSSGPQHKSDCEHHMQTRTTLTTTKPSDSQKARVKVWAIAPSSISLSPTVWMSADREVALKAAAEPSHQPNALRDGRHHPIDSPSAAWDTRLDPRLAGPMGSSAASSFASRKIGGTLSSSTANAKRPPAAAKGGINKPKARNGLSVNGSRGGGRANGNGNASVKSNEPAKEQASQPSRSLFSSKRLGQDAANRMKAKHKTEQAAKTSAMRKGLKKRRITFDDDDDDDDEADENNGSKVNEVVGERSKKSQVNEHEDDDEEEDPHSPEARERKALERERDEDDERAEVERELQDLVDEPESPEMKDVDVEAVLAEEVESNAAGAKKEGVKRSFRETFGLPEQTTGSRRIRKEVEVTVEENGYLVTRRIMKTFDEHGNEVNVPDKECEKTEEKDTKLQRNPGNQPREREKSTLSCIPSMSAASSAGNSTPKSQKRAINKATPNTKGAAAAKDKTKNAKSSTKKSSKVKGKNIMSYFGKK